LQHIANNTTDAFTDYKGVTKSYNLVRNVLKRVEVPNKTTQLPSKRGRSTAISTDPASSKQRKRKNKSFNPVSATQPHAEEHPVEVQPSHPTSMVHPITDAGISNALMRPSWEMMMHQKGSEKFPSIMLKLESHLIERL
jgi:hypothetical protein